MGEYGPRGLGREDFMASRPAALLEYESDAGDGCAWGDAWAVAPAYELRGPGGKPTVADSSSNHPTNRWPCPV